MKVVETGIDLKKWEKGLDCESCGAQLSVKADDISFSGKLPGPMKKSNIENLAYFAYCSACKYWIRILPHSMPLVVRRYVYDQYLADYKRREKARISKIISAVLVMLAGMIILGIIAPDILFMIFIVFLVLIIMIMAVLFSYNN